jgi:short subunit dehydrogenase-like uncharacterized protein
MLQNQFLLYGANGYSGTLIARYAAQYGLRPVLAGRNKAAIAALAEKLDLPFLIIDLNNRHVLEAVLGTVRCVVHAAGPFVHTARQMIEACIASGTHYLDINGDISVFELIKTYNEAALKAGVMLMPGVGFDVVPTDCTALLLKQQLPDATHLQLAFATLGGTLSHGTATTMVEKLGEGGKLRKNGEIIHQPLGHKGMTVDFGPRRLFVMSIPWGDISTAHFTTGIPNIETYTGVPKKMYYLLKAQFLFNWLLRTRWMRGKLQKKINRNPAGPADDRRSKATGYVWGRATNAAGKSVEARLSGPEGYTITLHATLLIAQKVLNKEFKPGYQTPAAVYGPGLVLEIPGVKREVVAGG